MPPKSMPFFPNAKDFKVDGGDFSDINGNQNNYYGTANPLHVHGDNNSTTIVDGPYHNGPDNSISNDAGENIDVYGQGENCMVNLGSMDDQFLVPEASSRSSTRQHNTRTPVARPSANASIHQGLNNRISNRAGGNMRVFGQGRGSRINASLAQQSMPSRNGMYSSPQAYGVEHGYPPQYPYPSPSHYEANMQHQMRFQHPNGCVTPSPPPAFDRANSPSQMMGYPLGNCECCCHHHNAPYSPPTGYPPPASPPPFERTSYLAANHPYMWNIPHPGVSSAPPTPIHATSYPAQNNKHMEYHAPPHPGVSSSPPAIFQTPAIPPFAAARYPSVNNQYAPYESRPSGSLAVTTSAPPTPSLPPVQVRVPVPVQSLPGIVPANPAPAQASPPALIPALVLPRSHPPPPTPTPAPSRAPAEQVSALQESSTVGVAPSAALLPRADTEDIPQSPLPVATVHAVHSNRPRQEEQTPLATPRPVVAGALTNVLNPGPAAPSSAPPSVYRALPAPVTQRVERQDALTPTPIVNTSSPASASTLIADSVPAASQGTPARLGNGNNINAPTATVTENVPPGVSKIKTTSQEVLLEEADTFSKAEITNDPSTTKSKSKVKIWRRPVLFINRQAKKFKKVQVKE